MVEGTDVSKDRGTHADSHWGKNIFGLQDRAAIAMVRVLEVQKPCTDRPSEIESGWIPRRKNGGWASCHAEPWTRRQLLLSGKIGLESAGIVQDDQKMLGAKLWTTCAASSIGTPMWSHGTASNEIDPEKSQRRSMPMQEAGKHIGRYWIKWEETSNYRRKKVCLKLGLTI